MRDIFRDVSKEVEEAARIEGANLWQIFWMIALAAFVGRIDRHGGDCFLLFLERGAVRVGAYLARMRATLPSFILASRSTRGVDFNVAAVNTILAIAPPVIMSFFVQRYLARGLSFGAVKG